MPKTNYEHEQRRYRRELLMKKISNRKQTEIARHLGVTPPAVSQKKMKCGWDYEELCYLFSDKNNFSNDDILIIMGRKPDNPQENPICKYLLGQIEKMIAGQVTVK